ncbi:hypothetical protein ACFQ36_17405 [Arthrobacter sp. GCM10027362]|uniref:hypothetical protein n=1 Tax=Arthrobacter sp. GCM10027362 TaxID=3273379 RepID=UPI0036349CD3
MFPDLSAGPLPVAAGGLAAAGFGQCAGEPVPEFAGLPEGLAAAGQARADVPVEVCTDAGTATAQTTFHVEPLEPGFATPAFPPAAIHRGPSVTLHGRNFHFAPVAVNLRPKLFFGTPPPFEAGEAMGTPTQTEITVRVPGDLPMLGPIAFGAGSAVVVVATGRGSAQCPDLLPIKAGWAEDERA